MTKRQFVIFYSWQADLPNATNRGLIGDALERAAKALADDVDALVEPVIDRDTSGVSGSPDISSTILDKIVKADAVISDVSIITPSGDTGRRSPNPNVLLELGYALKAHGWQHVVMVMNKHYGAPELLPFDLRGRRALTYVSAPTDTSRSEARQSLQSQFEAALRAILANKESPVGEALTPVPLRNTAVQAIEQQRVDRASIVRRFATEVIDRVISAAPDLAKQEFDLPALTGALNVIGPAVGDFAEVAGIADASGDEAALEELYRALEPLADRRDVPRGFSGTTWEHQFEYFDFLVYEMLLILVACLLRERRVSLAGNMLRSRLHIANGQFTGDQGVEFLAPRTWWTLGTVKAPGGGRYISPIGQFIRAQFEDPEALKAIRLEDLEAADLFLFLFTSLPGRPLSDKLSVWRAHVAVLATRPPRFLIDAVRIGAARELASAVGQASPEALRDAIADHGRRMLLEPFRDALSRLRGPLADFKPERIGSEP